MDDYVATEVIKVVLSKGYSKYELVVRAHGDAPVYLSLTIDEKAKRVEVKTEFRGLEEYVREAIEEGSNPQELIDEIIGSILALITELRSICKDKGISFSDDFSKAKREALNLLDEVLEEVHQ